MFVEGLFHGCTHLLAFLKVRELLLYIDVRLDFLHEFPVLCVLQHDPFAFPHPGHKIERLDPLRLFRLRGRCGDMVSCRLLWSPVIDSSFFVEKPVHELAVI